MYETYNFLANYLSYKSPFKDILIYHGVGSGKTGAGRQLPGGFIPPPERNSRTPTQTG